MTASNKKILSYIIKITVVILAFWYIEEKVVNNQDLANFGLLIEQSGSSAILLILFSVFLLMFFNWGIEVVKWQALLKSVEKISFYRAFESVFCGLTFAIFTPSRIGEYGGRVFFLSPKRRIVGIVAMAVGTIGQLILTYIFGVIAACLFIYRFIPMDYRVFYLIVFVAAIFCCLLLVFYFNIRWIQGFLLSMKITRKFKNFYKVLRQYKKKELLRILTFSLLRYVVFSTQYFILLQWLIPGLNFFDVTMMMCIVFLVQSSLPSLDIFDIGVRSLTATYFFGFITDDAVSVIATVACIWLINIIIPAIIGTYFVFKLNFFGNSQSA